MAAFVSTYEWLLKVFPSYQIVLPGVLPALPIENYQQTSVSVHGEWRWRMLCFE